MRFPAVGSPWLACALLPFRTDRVAASTVAQARARMARMSAATLRDSPTEVVCEITIEALSQLGRASGITGPTEIFGTTRDAIERVAGDKYDRTSREPYELVTITTDDLQR